MMAQLCQAVAGWHDCGVLHRDIKPSNVMIDRESNKPVLMDFGLAKEIGQENATSPTPGR